jgi:hypothetical protein
VVHVELGDCTVMFREVIGVEVTSGSRASRIINDKEPAAVVTQ